MTVNSIGSLGCAFFAEGPVQSYADVQRSDTAEFARYFRFMLEHGIHLAPSQFEAMFISTAHDQALLDETLEAYRAYLQER